MNSWSPSTRTVFALCRNLFWAMLAVTAFVLATTASANTWSLVSSISVAPTDPLSLGNDGTRLLVLHNSFGGDRVHLYATNGTLLADHPMGSNFTNGIDGVPAGVVIGRGPSADMNSLHLMNPANGSIAGPFGSVGWGGSMAFDGAGTLYVVDGGTSNVIRVFDAASLTQTGTVAGPTPFSLTINSGLGWLNGRLHILSGPSDPTVYVVDGSLAVLGSIDVSSVPSPRDITFLGGDLYVVSRSTQRIYRFVPAKPTSTTHVSWGRVKRIYGD